MRKQLHIHLPDAEHEAAWVLAQAVGHSMTTCVRALIADACDRLGREPATVAALISGFRLGVNSEAINEAE